MKRDFFINNWQLITINILVCLCFFIGFGYFGDLIFDSFREVYIPEQISKGQILYKNIFNIYAPFAYLFNTALMKVFGTNLNTLYYSALITTLGIVNLIYLIGQKFLSKNVSLSIVLFFIFTTVLSPNVFNCFFPYSYGMLYGLLFILGSMCCIINNKTIPAYFFYSLAICSKYEFLLFLPILFFASGKTNLWKNLTALFVPIFVLLSILFIQGVKLEDLLASFQLILTMSSTKTLYWFYSVSGLVFRPQIIPIYLLNFVKLLVPITILYFFKQKYLLPIIFMYCYFVFNAEVLIFAFPLILILFAIKYKNINKPEMLLVLASMLISIKMFFALLLQSYGAYFTPFALISLFILLPKSIRKHFAIIVLMAGISLGLKNIHNISLKTVKIETAKGVVYSRPYIGNSINEVIKYIEQNTKETDRVLVYPECLTINVMANRTSDNKFYSLIPLYIETFGEELIIKRLEKTKPEYIIINNYDTSVYYYSHFGEDYAGYISIFVQENYDKVAEIGNGLKFNVYKIRR